MGLKIGVCGVGAFAGSFIQLFNAHPLVDKVVLADLLPDRLSEQAKKHQITDTCNSLDELIKTDVDAIALFTQNWLHGPQAVKALRAGKHVYSAVPSAISIDEISELVRTVEETGQIYMVGETSYYYPCAVYCRKKHAEGAFGKIVYAEGEYYHDWDHGLYQVMKQRGGEEWRKFAGGPPMYYPTHSTSMLISVSGAYATHVSCIGWTDEHEDGIYKADVNQWGNEFSNETALFKMSDGSAFRVNEYRRIGHPGTCGMSIYGTEGSYEEQAGAGDLGQTSVWVTKDKNQSQDLSALLDCKGVQAESDSVMAQVDAADGTHKGAAAIHDFSRLPKEFIGLSNGHKGSHQFLIDDFVVACHQKKQPPNNIWQAARYLVPGLIAHESAKKGGEQLEIPDFGAGHSE